MKKIMCAMIFVAIVFSAGLVSAQTKIGVVNVPMLLEQSDAGKAASANLDRQFKARKDNIDKQGQDIKKFTEDTEKQLANLKPEDRAAKGREFETKMSAYQKSITDFERDFQDARGKLYNPIAKVIQEVITTYAQNNGFGLVLDGVQAGVAYADAATDITQPVLQAFNAAWKSGKR